MVVCCYNKCSAMALLSGWSLELFEQSSYCYWFWFCNWRCKKLFQFLYRYVLTQKLQWNFWSIRCIYDESGFTALSSSTLDMQFSLNETAMSVKHWICWVYLLQRGKTSTSPKRGVGGMTLVVRLQFWEVWSTPSLPLL